MDPNIIFLIVGIVLGFGALQGYRVVSRRLVVARRWREIVAAFGEKTGADIAAGKIWVGMTARQLELSRGLPADKKSKTFAGKSGDYSRDTWTYVDTEKQPALRVYIEKGEVTGWKD